MSLGLKKTPDFSDVKIEQAHSTDVVHGSYENILRKKPFPTGFFVLFMSVVVGGYFFLAGPRWKDHMKWVLSQMPDSVQSRFGMKAPGNDYVLIDGKYYKYSPTNVYEINGQRVYFKVNARKPAAGGAGK
jgi:hypothetical protein